MATFLDGRTNLTKSARLIHKVDGNIMLRREEFLKTLWTEYIDTAKEGYWIDNYIREAERDGAAAFADVGHAIIRLRDLGASDADLSAIYRGASYEAIFGALYSLGCQILDDEVSLHEDLLGADPSGREGRPKPRASAV